MRCKLQEKLHRVTGPLGGDLGIFSSALTPASHK